MSKKQQLFIMIMTMVILLFGVITVVSNMYYSAEKINEVKDQCAAQIKELEQACKESCNK